MVHEHRSLFLHQLTEIPALKSAPNYLAIVAVFIVAPAWAQAPSEDVDSNQDFELAGAGVAGLDGDGGLEMSDVSFVGTPLKDWFKNWPEDLVIAPIPGRSPQMGWKLTLAGGYFLESRDEDSDASPSVLGGFAMIAENGSYAYGAGANLRLLDDKLRVKIGGGFADVRYRFYGFGNNVTDVGVDILQEGPLYFASGMWRVWNKLYLGLGYLQGEIETRLRFAPPDSLFFDPSLNVDMVALTIPIEFDSRDHEQFPRSGWFVSGRTMLYRESLGSDFDAETFKLAVNNYRPMGERNVLALRGVLRSTSGEAPFFLLSTFGGSTDLRGYPSGRYRDAMMYALQGEYRWQHSDRWIFTGFAGFGEVADDFSGFGRDFLPAAGIGARFVLSQKHRVGLSADIAVGKDGTEFYFGVGEAF